MNFVNSKLGQAVKFVIDANFYISVLFLLYCGFTAIAENYTVFKFNEELYGVIHNNLRIALLYLAMTEAVVGFYCIITKNARLMLYVGYFHLMMLGSLAFYGKLNAVPIDSNLPLFFLYVGLSHIAFGLISGLDVKDQKRILH